MNIQEFWAEVNRIAAQLPLGDVVYVCSLDCKTHAGGTIAGRVSEAPRKVAAEWIVQGTHRVATPEEITKHDQAAAEQAKAIAAAEYKRKQNFALPEELTNLITAAVAGTQQARAVRKERD